MTNVYLGGNIKDAEQFRRDCQFLLSSYGYLRNKIKLLDPQKNSESILNIYDHEQELYKTDEYPTFIKELIVKDDKKMIDSCDFVMCYIEKPSFGTVMEIMYAYEKNIPVLVILPTTNYEHLKNDVWLSFHATHFFHHALTSLDYIHKHIEL